MAACTRHPTRPAPVPTGRSKSKKRPAEDVLEDKTDVLEEGQLAAWFLNEMDQATQTDPVPYAPVDRPGVWMCPLHPDESLSEGRKNEFVYVYCPRNTCPVFSPQDRVDEWMTLVAQQLHEELRQRWDELTCFCDRRLALRKSGSEKNPQRMYLACRDGGCRCFLWLNLPLSGKMRRRVDGEDWSSSHLPNTKRACLAARLRGVDGSLSEGFMMCDNGYNTLSSPGIFEGLRYRPWMHGAWEEYQGASTPDARRQVLLLAYARYEGEDGHHPESPRVLNELREHWLEGKPKVWRGSVFTADEMDRLNQIRQSRLDPERPWWRRDSVNQ